MPLLVGVALLACVANGVFDSQLRSVFYICMIGSIFPLWNRISVQNNRLTGLLAILTLIWASLCFPTGEHSPGARMARLVAAGIAGRASAHPVRHAAVLDKRASASCSVSGHQLGTLHYQRSLAYGGAKAWTRRLHSRNRNRRGSVSVLQALGNSMAGSRTCQAVRSVRQPQPDRLSVRTGSLMLDRPSARKLSSPLDPVRRVDSMPRNSCRCSYPSRFTGERCDARCRSPHPNRLVVSP